MYKLIKTILFLYIIFAFQCFGNATENYQAQLDNLVSEQIPGVVLLVEAPNVHFLGSAGYSNIEDKTPMSSNAVMPNGSAGKKLTALLVAMLHYEKIIDLDAPINNYLSKGLLNKILYSESMTIRQLLNHTSGVFEYNDVEDNAFFKAQFTQADKLKTDIFPLRFALEQEASFKPGEGYSYSNTGYALIGVILEKVLGEHPSKAIRKRIIDPLSMSSSYVKGVEKHVPDLISGYFINDTYPDFPLQMNVWIDFKDIIGSSAFSDAPLASNVIDIAKLLKSIVTGNEVVKNNVRKQMIGNKNLVKAWGAKFYKSSELYYGLGIFVEKINGITIYHHGGTEFGYFTQNIYIPDGDISITAFTNCGVNDYCEGRFQELTFNILDSFLGITKVI